MEKILTLFILSCYTDCCTVWINITSIFNFYPATMSRVLAIKDYTGPDCRYLSFKSGEEIMVYFKLSREREDLWAGSVSIGQPFLPSLEISHELPSSEIPSFPLSLKD
uniref:SH3 domain-containing protein n=1 Tax=Naja naja TaxID=35670 RepID=A0A8C6XII2_NAJNA